MLDTAAVEYWVLCRARGIRKRLREGRTRDLEPNMLLIVLMMLMMVLMASDHENDEFDEEIS